MTTTTLTPAIDHLKQPDSARFSMGRGLLLDTLLPWGVYVAATNWFGCTPVHALLLSAIVPLADAARGLGRRQGANPVGLLVGLGILCSGAVMLLGGGARMLLLRESLFTGLLGVVCFASLLTPRPLMFFFMRYFVAGSDGDKQRQFDQGLERAGFRRVVRIVTAAWGSAFLVEFGVRAWLVFHCSPAVVLAASPLLMNGMIAGTTAWNVWYGRREKARAAQAAVPASFDAAATAQRSSLHRNGRTRQHDEHALPAKERTG